MLTCLPQSVCSWNFCVSGTSAGSAAITFNRFTEQGGISIGDVDYAVCKHGPWSGHWTLEHEGLIAADGHKTSAMFRSFEVSAEDLRLTVKAQTAFTRCYDMLCGGEAVGTIRPAHAFTRRAFIECDSKIPEPAQLFSFWLAALTWRRAARKR